MNQIEFEYGFLCSNFLSEEEISHIFEAACKVLNSSDSCMFLPVGDTSEVLYIADFQSIDQEFLKEITAGLFKIRYHLKNEKSCSSILLRQTYVEGKRMYLHLSGIFWQKFMRERPEVKFKFEKKTTTELHH